MGAGRSGREEDELGSTQGCTKVEQSKINVVNVMDHKDPIQVVIIVGNIIIIITLSVHVAA